ncbi:MAG: c-type cytochrome biogenesis protein CcmI [Halomonas sp.]|nr:c-type cytochrome biogenesis protein CcmI [Halomonas sp.]MDN6298170.1 c-type cytochrome biogenesis protein CcmI [Halomonas sp.]MDN6314620.1 c-type cytochrome biogenesis protein CcmI [Halomonas sp.]MDN6335744.1 c-type cytochrome biogenesis protein CcmI [Halomonas sp.]
MIPLWIGFAVLLVLALWLLVLPLRQSRRLHDTLATDEANDTAAEQNVAIFRRRLESLDAARARGDIDETQYAEDRLELERSLLDDTESRSRRPLKAATAGRLAVPVLMVAMVLASVVWYQQEGAEGDLALYAVQQEVQNDPEGSLAMYMERMEAQAERQPENPNVWGELFPLYRQIGQPKKAADALERLIALEGRHASLLAQLAQIRFFMAERELTSEVQALVDEIRQKDPREPTMLGVLGIHAFDNGDYKTAIDRWRRAVANIQDPDTVESLKQGIQVARQRMGIDPDEAADAEAPDHGIDVQVVLDPSLRDQVADDATVFITARDLAGELPPLAVVRTTVGELPATVTLSEQNAMSPRATLGQVDKARLVVRVSPSGQAMPQSGDLFGDADNVPVGAMEGSEPAEVTINRVFK